MNPHMSAYATAISQRYIPNHQCPSAKVQASEHWQLTHSDVQCQLYNFCSCILHCRTTKLLSQCQPDAPKQALAHAEPHIHPQDLQMQHLDAWSARHYAYHVHCNYTTHMVYCTISPQFQSSTLCTTRLATCHTVHIKQC